MKWKKFTLTTTTEAVDLVSSMLDDVGIEGIEVEDNVPLTEKETKGTAQQGKGMEGETDWCRDGKGSCR